jgi:hypothetical protein
MVLPPGFDSFYSYRVLSTNNRDTRVVFDASPSTDPFYLPMQFIWTAWDGMRFDGTPAFTHSGVRFTNVFEVGYYGISLQASDSIATGVPDYFLLQVTTADQEINSILAALQQMSLPAQKRRLLVNVLSKAITKFDQGHTAQGCADLRQFKNLLKVSKLTPVNLDYYSNETQFIIDAFNKPFH